MSRIQLALNVADVDEAVTFYTKLFGAAPAKVRPGYANFAIADPPLKLVLIEDPTRTPGSVNHLGVEVAGTGAVDAARARLADSGMATRSEQGTTCCYAVQDKVWVDGPSGEPWEIYTVLGDADGPAAGPHAAAPGEPLCCNGGSEPAPERVPLAERRR